ncbi:MAG: hypothetical protein ACUVSY_11710 [Roseiflexus sp.]
MGPPDGPVRHGFQLATAPVTPAKCRKRDSRAGFAPGIDQEGGRFPMCRVFGALFEHEVFCFFPVRQPAASFLRMRLHAARSAIRAFASAVSVTD